MKVVLSWLRELCPTDLGAEELADLLTANGVKVEEILRPWAGLDRVVVARVLEVRDHPNSNKLCLARVDSGSGEREVVVGVRNMGAGDLVPYAPPGSRVPALPEPLGARAVRGVTSTGMLCSPRELGIADVHEGILILPPELTPGSDVKAAFGLDDAVLDIEIEPNRPDLMSVVGVARETSAATGVPLQHPDSRIDEDPRTATAAATLEVLDRKRCPRYLARVIAGVTAAPAPIRAQARLTAAGMRPRSGVVDATNYALLELGQPLHPFDLAKLDGPGIVVRPARSGEALETLDGVERRLAGQDLVIADRTNAIAIAGIMGSAAAEVSDATTDVLLESAHFERIGILRTSRRLGLSTEASARFERGADPEAVRGAADRAAGLIVEWAGGRVLAGHLNEGSEPERRWVSVRPSRTSLVLGAEVDSADVAAAFDRLAMATKTGQDEVSVEIPGYRVDIDREVDLIEEVARIRGYDLVGSTIPAVRQAGGLPPAYAFVRTLRAAAVRAGLREVRTLSFASADDLALTGDDDDAIRVANPIRAEEGFLQTSLIPGLLDVLARNLARGVGSVAVFEVGTVFTSGDPVREEVLFALAMTGAAVQGWSSAGEPLDVFDAKGALEAVLRDVGVDGWTLDEPPAEGPFHPGRSATIEIGGREAGILGELHPSRAGALDLAGRVAVAELDVASLLAAAGGPPTYVEVPRFPPVRRDLAFVVDRSAPAGALAQAIRAAGGELVGRVSVFDVFEGEGIADGRKSLAFSLDFRAPDRTLTDEEADGAVAAIVDRIETEFGGRLRTA